MKGKRKEIFEEEFFSFKSGKGNFLLEFELQFELELELPSDGVTRDIGAVAFWTCGMNRDRVSHPREIEIKVSFQFWVSCLARPPIPPDSYLHLRMLWNVELPVPIRPVFAMELKVKAKSRQRRKSEPDQNQTGGNQPKKEASLRVQGLLCDRQSVDVF